VFPKLYSLVCVYVCFRIWGTTNERFTVDFVKIILANWQIYTWQCVQFAQNAMAHYQIPMDSHWNLLMRVLLKMRVKTISLTFHFWINTHFVLCVWHPSILHTTFLSINLVSMDISHWHWKWMYVNISIYKKIEFYLYKNNDIKIHI